MIRLKVTCISKMSGDAEKGITHIGGARWKHSEEHAISNIKRNIIRYYIHDNKRSVELVVIENNGKEWLHTRTNAAGIPAPGDLPGCN